MDLFNPANTRKFFPYFCSEKRGDNIYFDNAATTHKPLSVINRITDFYVQENSNIHRGVYGLGVSATDQYESCRRLIHKFIGSNSSKEIILTSGTTESVNLVAPPTIIIIDMIQNINKSHEEILFFKEILSIYMIK